MTCASRRFLLAFTCWLTKFWQLNVNLIFIYILQAFCCFCYVSVSGTYICPSIIYHISILGPPTNGSEHPLPFEDLKNWDYTISYDMGSASPLSPSFNFSLELVRSTQVRCSCSLLGNKKSFTLFCYFATISWEDYIHIVLVLLVIWCVKICTLSSRNDLL
jgi:hypothetical protein